MKNIVDDTLGYLSPEYALKTALHRNAVNILNSESYDISTPTENYDIGEPTTTDEDLIDLETARDTSRLKAKNNGFYKGILKASRDHVIGTGLRSKSTLNRRRLKNIDEARIKEIENDTDDVWNDWVDSQHSDITGVNNFYLQQRLAYYRYKIDGECFASLPILNNAINLKLIGAEFIEGDDEGFNFGIKTDIHGKAIAYNVLQEDSSITSIIQNTDTKQNMLHLFDRERVDILRGFPFLSTSARDLDYIDAYMKDELKAARIAALFMGSIETAATEDIFKKPSGDLSGIDTISNNSKIDPNKKTFNENTITQLQKGEKLNIHLAGRDNPNFEQFVKTALQKVATDTRIPVEIILTIFTSSYSASRASMLLMDKFVQPERMIFNRLFNNPIRNQVIEWAVLNGKLNIPGFFENKTEFLRSEWIGDAMGSVDPVKDAKAKISLIENHLTTRTKATQDLGQGDFERNVKQLEKENDLLEESNLLKKEDENELP